MTTERTAPRRWRRFAIHGVWLASAVVLTGRLHELQIVQHAALTARAQAQAESVLVIPGPRGEIVDRNARLLAGSMPVQVLAAELKRIPARGVALLETAADVPGRLVRRAQAPWFEVRRDCDQPCVDRVMQLVKTGDVPADALHWAQGFTRRYPYGPLAAHVLGFVTNDGAFAEGAEKTYDRLLRSAETRVLRITDARLTPIESGSAGDEPAPCSALMLTLDLRIQTVLEKALEDAVEARGARAAQGIVLDPRTGEVLALANYPTFDPNTYGKWPADARSDVAAQRPFEPGSVMKPFTAAAIVENGLYRPGERVYCEKGLWRRRPRDLHDTHPHGNLTLPEVLEVSSNIGIVKFSQRLTHQQLFDTLYGFGFGRRTGLDLPAESAGRLSKPEQWRGVDQDMIAFGHTISTTTVQLATAYSVIAAGGLRPAPHVGRAVRGPETNAARDLRSAPQGADRVTLAPAADWRRLESAAPERVLSPRTAAQVGDWMRRVVEGEHGTGKLAAVEGFVVAGKTGTAELATDSGYDKLHNMSTFAGFAPRDEPAAVVVITLNSPTIGGRTGGVTAAPVFASVMGETLRLLRVAPDHLPESEDDAATPPARRAAVTGSPRTKRG